MVQQGGIVKADFQDRLNIEKPESSFKTWFIFGGLATCIIGGLLILNKDKDAIVLKGPWGKLVHYLKEPSMQKTEPLKPIIEYVLPPRPVREPRPVAVRPEDVTSPIIEQWERERKEKEHARKKQTVFNDDNYTPRGAHNIARLTTSQRTNPPIAQTKKFTKTHRVKWTWESYGSGFSKHNKYGEFTYIETERGIDTASVCGNYKYGSLDYRDCRKAAKKWFQDRCSNSFRQACLAGNMIP